MADFFEYLSGHPVVAAVLTAAAVAVLLVIVLICVWALSTGRPVKIGPISIGSTIPRETSPRPPASQRTEIVEPGGQQESPSFLKGQVTMARSIVLDGEKENIRGPDSRVATELAGEVGKVVFEDPGFSIESPSSHLIVIGSPRYNPYATALQRTFHLPFQYVISSHEDDAEKSTIEIVTTYGEELTSSRDRRIGVSETEIDYGILFVGNLKNQKKVIWLSGIHGVGTLGVHQFFQDRKSQLLDEFASVEGIGTAQLLRVRYRRKTGGSHSVEEILGVEALGDLHQCSFRDRVAGQRILISDLGNVVMYFDRTRTYRGIAHACEIPYETVKAAIEGSTIRERFEKGHIDEDAFLSELPRLVGDNKGRLNHTLATELWGDIFWPNAEMIRALATMRSQGIRVVLLSNTNPIHFHHVMRYYPQVLEAFDEAVLSYQEGQAKPDRQIFHRAIEKALEGRAGAQASDIIYIDDKEKYVEIARSLGMEGFAYRSYPQFAFWLRKRGVYID